MITLKDAEVERAFAEAGFKLKRGLEHKHWGAAMRLSAIGGLATLRSRAWTFEVNDLTGNLVAENPYGRTVKVPREDIPDRAWELISLLLEALAKPEDGAQMFTAREAVPPVWAQHPDPTYPHRAAAHIDQFAEGVFVWYDEAALPGGAEPTLQAAQQALAAYGAQLNGPDYGDGPEFKGWRDRVAADIQSQCVPDVESLQASGMETIDAYSAGVAAATEAAVGSLVALQMLVKRIVKHAERDQDSERHGHPGHCHNVRNRWDADGSVCQECIDWDLLRAVARGAS